MHHLAKVLKSSGPWQGSNRPARRRLLRLLTLTLISCGESPLPSEDDSRVIWHVAEHSSQGQPFFDDSTAYFQGARHEVTAVWKHSGVVRWSVALPVDGSNTVGDGGIAAGDKLIVGDRDVFALSARDGSILWRFGPSGIVNVGRLIPVVWNDLVLVGSSSGYAFGVDLHTGTMRWSSRLSIDEGVQVWTPNSPVIDGTLYVTIVNFDSAPNNEPQGSVAALDALTGHVKWQRSIPHHVDPMSPTASLAPVVVGGVVVTDARDGPLYAFDRADGALRWKAPPLPNALIPVPDASIRDTRWLATCSGRVYAGSTSSTIVVAINPESGEELWRTSPQPSSARPVWCDSRSVFVLRPLGGLEALDAATGRTRWSLTRAPYNNFFFGAAADGDRLYSGSTNSGLFALRNN